MAEFLALFVGDGGAQVLDLNESFADENDLSDIWDTSNPAVTDQLRIQHQSRVSVGNEFIAFRNRPRGLDLQVLPGLADV